jgi:hypothetical protein
MMLPFIVCFSAYCSCSVQGEQHKWKSPCSYYPQQCISFVPFGRNNFLRVLFSLTRKVMKFGVHTIMNISWTLLSEVLCLSTTVHGVTTKETIILSCNLCSFIKIGGKILRLYKTAGKIVVFYILAFSDLESNLKIYKGKGKDMAAP